MERAAQGQYTNNKVYIGDKWCDKKEEFQLQQYPLPSLSWVTKRDLFEGLWWHQGIGLFGNQKSTNLGIL